MRLKEASPDLQTQLRYAFPQINAFGNRLSLGKASFQLLRLFMHV